MNLTLQLLRSISLPTDECARTDIPPSNARKLELYNRSIKNRISFFYLDALKKNRKLGPLGSIYERKNMAYLKTLDLIARCSRLLSEANIEHAIFKTIRPYKSTTVDIDVLIFQDQDKYFKAIKMMQQAGFRFVVRGPRSTTLMDQELHIGIDLYEQIAVSFITYMDKEKIIDQITTVGLPNGEYVRTLKPEADLACIIAHSVIKEQMYALAEYYTFIYYLKQISRTDFLEIVKRNNITLAARMHMTITKLLHRAAYGTTPSELQQLLNDLGEERLETTRLIQSNLKTPQKYHPITVARSLLEIAKGKTSRKSIAMQFFHMLNPKFTKSFAVALIDHAVRESY